MIGAINVGASSLLAHSRSLSATANNVANLNTNGFQRSSVNLQSVGGNAGVAVGATSRDTNPGPLLVTGRRFDLAVAGDGFFQVQLGNGEIGFTRDGSFNVNANGEFVNANGQRLAPPIAVPPDATSVNIGGDGAVSVTTANNPNSQVIGNVTLARFSNSQGLEAGGGNLFFATAASGAPQVGVPGAGGFGSLEQGVLEGSNVNPVTELTSLLLAQRGFELGTKIIKTGDEVYQATIDLVG